MILVWSDSPGVCYFPVAPTMSDVINLKHGGMVIRSNESLKQDHFCVCVIAEIHDDGYKCGHKQNSCLLIKWDWK